MQAPGKWEYLHQIIISSSLVVRAAVLTTLNLNADCGFTQQIKLWLQRLVCKMQPGQVDKNLALFDFELEKNNK
jgi:hypothetical protein